MRYKFYRLITSLSLSIIFLTQGSLHAQFYLMDPTITVFAELQPGNADAQFPFHIRNISGGTAIDTDFNMANTASATTFTDVAYDANGTMAVVSNGLVYIKKSGSSQWSGPGNITGASRVTISPDKRIYVVTNGNIWESGVDNLVFTQSSNNGGFMDVAAGTDNTVLAISNGWLMKWHGNAGANGAWTVLNNDINKAVRIMFLHDNRPAYVDQLGTLRYSPDKGAYFYFIINDVIDAATSLNGGIWLIRRTDSGTSVQYGNFDQLSFSTIAPLARGNSIAVSPTANPTVTTSGGKLYLHDNTSWNIIEPPIGNTPQPANSATFFGLQPGTYRISQGMGPDIYNTSDIRIAGSGSVSKNIPARYADVTVTSNQHSLVTFVNALRPKCNELIGAWTNNNWTGSGNDYYQDNTEVFSTSSISQDVTGWTKGGTGADNRLELGMNVLWNNAFGGGISPNCNCKSTGISLVVKVGGMEYARVTTPNGEAGTNATVTYSNGASGSLSQISETDYKAGPPAYWKITFPALTTDTQKLEIVAERGPDWANGSYSDDIRVRNMSIEACDGSAAITISHDTDPDSPADFGFGFKSIASGSASINFTLRNDGKLLPDGLSGLADLAINAQGNLYVSTAAGRVYRKAGSNATFQEPNAGATATTSVDAGSSDEVYQIASGNAFASGVGGGAPLNQINDAGAFNQFKDIGANAAGTQVFAVGNQQGGGSNLVLRYQGGQTWSVASNSVTDAARIDVLSDGNPVYASTGGAVSYSADGGATFSAFGDISGVADVAGGADGSVWAVKNDGTVWWRASTITGSFSQVPSTGLTGAASRITVDPAGMPYVITPSGLFVFNNSQWLPVETRTNASSNVALFGGLSAGTYTITESALPAGFSLDNIAFTTANGSGSAPVVVVDQATKSATVTIGNGQEVFLRFKSIASTNSTNAVIDINQGPNAQAVTGNVLLNDIDPEGHSLSVTGFEYDNNSDGEPETQATLGQPQQVTGVTSPNWAIANAGTFTLNADGSYVFMPASGFQGAVTIRYQMCDNGSPSACDATILGIRIRGGSYRIPNTIAHNDHASTEMGVRLDGQLVANDVAPNGYTSAVSSILGDKDGDGSADDVLPNNQSSQIYGTDMNGNIVVAGGFSYQATGVYFFFPADGFLGKVTLAYNGVNGRGGTDDVKAEIDVIADKGNTTFANDDANFLVQRTPQKGNVLTNDSDPEKNAHNVTAATNSAGAPIAIGTTTTLPSGGQFKLNSNGTYEYYPQLDFIGTETVRYTKCDNAGGNAACASATLFLSTFKAILRPNAVDDVAETVMGVPVSGNIKLNDYDPENREMDLFSINYEHYFNNKLYFSGGEIGQSRTVIGLNADGTVNNNAGTFIINQDGTYTYNPAAGFTGLVQAKYSAYTVAPDGNSYDDAILSVTVFNPNPGTQRPPVANGDIYVTTMNTPVIGNLFSNDFDPDEDEFGFIEFRTDTDGDGQNDGYVDWNGTTELYGVDIYGVSRPAGTLNFIEKGHFTFTPNAWFIGTVSSYYQINNVGQFSFGKAPFIIDVRSDNGFVNYDYGDLTGLGGASYPQATAAFKDNNNDQIPDDAGAVWLGKIEDGEQATTVRPNGKADDIRGMNDDDGLKVAGVMAPGTVNWIITANSNGPATAHYGIWLDWGTPGAAPDGTFDAFYSGTIQTSSPADQTVSVAVPPSFATGALVNVRLMVGTVPFDPATGFAANLSNGEIEDYQFTYEEAMPVRLVSFTAIASENDALLAWTGLDQQNFNRYEIERGSDGKHFGKVGIVKSNGSDKGDYTFIDSNASAAGDLLYYRLKMIDHDSTYAFSRIRSVRFSNAAANASVTPTVVLQGENIQVKLTGSRERTEVQLISLSGVVYGRKFISGDQSTEFTSGDLPSGTYLVRINGENWQRVTKIVIAH